MQLLRSVLVFGLLSLGFSIQAQVPIRSLTKIGEFPLPPGEIHLAWDTGREAVYCSDPVGQRVWKLGLSDGSVLGDLSWTNAPDRLALCLDGQELFVTLPVRPHDPMWMEDQWGYVSVIDPDFFEELRRIRVEIDPHDVAPTSDGTMVVSSGSGQWTYLDTYNAATGERLGTQTGLIPALAKLALHPDGERLYLSDWSVLQRLDRQPTTRAFWRPGDPVGTVSGDVGGQVWFHPDGERILTASGRVYSCSVNPEQDLQPMMGIETSTILALAFDEPRRTLFTADQFALDPVLHQWELDSLTPAARYPLPGRPLSLLVHGDALLIAMQGSDGSSVVARYLNPASGAEFNTPPVAAFGWSPTQPTTIHPVLLDASASTDQEDPDDLWFRWDLHGDGAWDTEWTTEPTIVAGYHVAGSRTVHLEVRDSMGAVSRISHVLEVILEEDSGQPASEHPPYALPFEVARVAFDAGRGRLYATDPVGQRMVVIDLASGLMVLEFSFFLPPEAVAMTPDGRWLYVALLAAPHNSFISGGGSGYVAEFDLERMVKTHEFAVSVDPFALVATDNRRVVVSGGSSQMTEVQSYDGVSGARLGALWANEACPMALLPSQDRFFLLWEHSHGAVVTTMALDPVTGEVSQVAVADLLIRAGAISLNENASLAATARGSVFGLSAQGAAVLPGWNLPTESHVLYSAVLFDAIERGMVFGAIQNELRVFNGNSLLQVTSLPLVEPAQFLGRQGESLYAVSTRPNRTTIRLLTNPALGSEGNLPPVVRLEVQPQNPTTRFPMSLDASGTTDEGPVQFRWDLDGDGVFDTDWGDTAVVSRHWIVPGTYRTVVEARDIWGEVDRAEVEYVVTLEADPGLPAFSHPPRELPFSAAAVAFDPVRGQLWLSDPAGGSIVRVNLDSGQAERRWQFDLEPESLAITPNGARLFAALLAHPHDYFWRNQVGYIAEYDLEADRLERVLQIDIDPGDLAATDHGYLFVAGGSGGQTSVNCYRVAPFALLGQAPMYNGPRLAVAPSQTAVYAATYWDSNPYITRFNFNPTTGVFGPGAQSPTAFDTVGGKVLVLPVETQLLSGTGAIWLSQPGATNDLRLVGDLGIRPVRDLAIFPGGARFAVAANQQFGYFDSTTSAPMGRFQLGRPAQFAGVSGGNLFLVSTNQGRTTIHQRLTPASDSSNNRAPTLRWLTPADGSAHAHPAQLVLEVEPEDVDGGIDWVRFYNGDQLLGVVTNHPFAIEVYTLPAGNFTLKAVASDNLGATTQPAPLDLRITYRPDVGWKAPMHPAVIDSGDDMLLEVQADDPDGSVVAVHFFQHSVSESNRVGTVDAPPWQWLVRDLQATTSFFAQAVDNDGIPGVTPAAVVQIAGPRGDEFYRPFPLEGTHAAAHASNRDATMQLFETSMLNLAGGRTLWWSWIAPSDGIYILDTRGSNFDTILGVYLGYDIARLTTVALNDDDPNAFPSSRVKFTARAGTEFRIRVDGHGESRGDVLLNLAMSSALILPPPNDRFADRTVLVGAQHSVPGRNLMATAEAGEPNHGGFPAGPSVWWEWQPTMTGQARISTQGSTFDTVLAVYSGSGTAVHQLTPVVANDDHLAGGTTSAVLFHATRTNYFIAVTGYAGQTGDIALHLELSAAVRPTNDDYANRTTIAGPNIQIAGTTIGATLEPGDPSPGFITSGTTVWYRWIAPATATAELVVTGPAPQNAAAVFQPGPGGTLTRVELAHHPLKQAQMRFHAVAGTEYAILMAGRFDYQGPFVLYLTMPDVLSPRLTLQSIDPDGWLRFHLSAGMEGRAILFASDNLADWTPIWTNQISPEWTFQVLPGPDPHQFFRVLIEQLTP